ncbi:2-oxoglutarate dehydrogenase complex dihydrolipoyllysine-residue succinyltransferase [Paenibacillus abyssi]|uniref:Dihydrolipoyllysine-residue succinyltransferase component of 2-oxoglutarate dehydrogenase complex n=1 Tax=Paenibacillus abyssi TaxID=1340531 RepID=A0A917LDW0_9BACL|nr:2-oxoglutarate dehydrogenase complex dihydrolipoyllysine-residue succinyltransferase [Paenibacillus abyssi]GGG14932.1 dihydrolipoyllysine-residue succinyltransferase component of 2-oxoglutarate dehydrogenase complex [Paenibacillus abyssi]
MNEIKIPELGESIAEGAISKWLKKQGDPVSQGDLLLELETDKVNLEVSAEVDGVLAEIVVEEGGNVKAGDTVGYIRAEGENRESLDINKEREQKKETPSGDYTASPSARRKAREQGIELNQVSARDPLGRVYSEDIRPEQTASKQKEQPARQKQQPSKQADSQSDAEPNVERIRMSRRRQTIAKRLVEAQQTAAMLTTFNEVDMTAILDVRERRKASFREKHDVGLGFMSFFTKAVIGALKEFPKLNAEIDGEEMVLKKHYDIGIAVSAAEGLVVPVVRNAERLGFAEIEKQIAALAEKARSNTLSLADLQGGTFTITNGGVFGSLLSTPILNYPQVGILGMHTIQMRPVAISKKKMANRPMMYIALSYDHRIVDGSEAVRFLVKVKELLEDPEALLLEG